MHELTICRALIEQVEAVAREHEARNVVSIIVQVGPLSGVVPELLERSFSVVQAGTVAEHAEIRIETLPVRCGPLFGLTHTVTAPIPSPLCPCAIDSQRSAGRDSQ